MTKREAAIVTMYTGFVIGDFSEAHKYAQEIIGRSIWTHEFASEKFCEEIKAKAKPDFVSIKISDQDRCCCCGVYVPEGRQVCKKCEEEAGRSGK